MGYWFEPSKPCDIAISSRIRLARNIKGIPFPNKMNVQQIKQLNLLVRDAIEKSDNPVAKKLKYIEMENIPEIERFAMVERHIISKKFALNYQNRAIIISDDESVCVMLGEEDHIRIQVLLAGLCLEKAYETANTIDNILCDKLDIAFDERLGFLTECPTNLGTGLRASVMLHLPLFEANGGIKKYITNITRMGFTIRGMYGEGTKSPASIYQLSNQITLGITEKEAIEKTTRVAQQFIENEKAYRKQLDMLQFEDRCMRSYGVLKNARILTSEELMSRMGDIMIGISLGIIKNIRCPMSIFVSAQPYMLMRKYGEMLPQSRDIERATMVRSLL